MGAVSELRAYLTSRPDMNRAKVEIVNLVNLLTETQCPVLKAF